MCSEGHWRYSSPAGVVLMKAVKKSEKTATVSWIRSTSSARPSGARKHATLVRSVSISGRSCASRTVWMM